MPNMQDGRIILARMRKAFWSLSAMFAIYVVFVYAFGILHLPEELDHWIGMVVLGLIAWLRG